MNLYRPIRGRGSQKKAKVLVMVESIPSEEVSKKGRKAFQNSQTSQNAGHTRPEIEDNHRYCQRTTGTVGGINDRRFHILTDWYTLP
jgi:hypothetical protein